MTIKEIAGALNVSAITVSRALNDKPDINAETKRRILRYVDEVGYSTDHIAKSLRTKRTNTIGVITTNISDPFYAAILSVVEDILATRGYSLLIVSTRTNSERERTAVRTLISKQVDGFLIDPVDAYEGQKKLFEQIDIPFVTVGRENDALCADAVAVDGFQCGYMGTKRLIDAGCRKIVYLNGMSRTTICDRGEAGYLSALREAGLQHDCGMIQYVPDAPSNAAYDSISKLIDERKAAFDGMLIHNDACAVRAIQALLARGIRIPADVSLISIGGSMLCESCCPQLSSVSIPIEEIGKQACDLLLDRIRNSPASGAAKRDAVRKYIRPHITDRRTV